ncbi:4Fe-4S binding protein [Methanocaldococcus infernus]
MDKLQIFRKIVQSFFFFRFVITASFCICFYGILQALFIGSGKNLIIKLVIVVIGTIILGRVFCGWICPFGFLQDLTYKLRFSKKLPMVRESLHNKLIYIKYFVMVIFLILSYYLATLAFCKICPIGFLTNLSGTLLALILLIFFLALSLFIPRGFCRYICPLGAFLSLFSISPIFKIKLNENCVKCKLCEFKCPMQITLTKKVDQKECIRCFECKSACKKNAIDFKI